MVLRLIAFLTASCLIAACGLASPLDDFSKPAAPASDAVAQPNAQTFFQSPPVWRGIFQGIDHTQMSADKPRKLVVQALRVDIQAEGLELVTTPANGEKPLETDGQTTRAFLEEHGLAIAINTHFFGPCCKRTPGEPKDLIGLAVAQGELVSPHLDASQRDTILFGPGLNQDHPGLSVLMYPDAPDVSELDSADWLAGVTHAISGRKILTCGRVLEATDPFATDLHPRTLVGYSHSSKYLYLVTIDGRQPEFSTGASLAESGAILRHLGAWHGINVDGGGSTTMVLRGPGGASQLVNQPSGGVERVVGSNLGFRAHCLQASTSDAP
jgi:hypothetical protein